MTRNIRCITCYCWQLRFSQYSYRCLASRSSQFKGDVRKGKAAINIRQGKSKGNDREVKGNQFLADVNEIRNRKTVNVIKSFSAGYQPPEDVKERMQRIVEDVIQPNQQDNWEEVTLEDLNVKFKVLARCQNEFQLVVPNFQLASMKNISNVLKFYKTPIKPKRTFSNIDLDKLPPNLVIDLD